MKLRAIAATAIATAALVPAVSPAQPAAAGPADSCYGFNYSYSIDSTAIRVTTTSACPGSSASAYLVLERYNGASGYPWGFVASSNGSLTYFCNGTTPTTYHVGPIFTPGTSGYTWYQFTANCG
ncbi:hypothetical protein ABT369_09515 [Dactylosporangium sp. NPDC000244]|uniref:hypothetical protein n=1 Tax=Dactylosporangium sp. NPDC000244 TaxID=3154365 RepID=UPI00332BA950